MIKKSNGITLISLCIVIVVMFIIASTTVSISLDRFEINNYNKMISDLELLDEKVFNYYLINNNLPVLRDNDGNIIRYDYSLEHIPLSPYDDVNYYIIDLKAMEGIALNYGKGFEDPSNPDDIYIINGKTHNIYYVKGIEMDGVFYHSNIVNGSVEDNLSPSSPRIKVISGEKNDVGIYITDIELEMIPGKDKWAGVKETTYSINGGPEINIITLENNILTITEEGYYKIKITTWDNKNNSFSQIYEFEIHKDETIVPPSTPEIKVISGEKNAAGIYYTDIELEMIPGIDRFSGFYVEKTTYSINGSEEINITTLENNIFKITEDGTYNIIIKSYNNYNEDYSSQNEYVLKKENKTPTSPTIDVISGNKNSDGIYTTDIELRINPGKDQGSGVSRTTYSTDGKTENDITTLPGNILKLTGEGTHNIIVKSYNDYGNSSQAEYSYIRKNMPPTSPTIDVVSGNKNSDGIYTTDIELRINPGKDQGSGVSRTTYSTDGKTENDITTLPGNILKLTGEGTHNIIVKSYNDYGNSSQAEYSFKRQNNTPSKPKIRVVSGEKDTSGTYYTAVELQIIPGVDNGSGVSRTTYSIDGKTENDITPLVNNILKLTQDGTYKIKIKTYNNYGNSSEIEYQISIKIINFIPTTQSYRGYYADVDRNGTVDGIIYADLAVSYSESSGGYSYSYSKKGNLNRYYISQEKYKANDAIGEAPVIAPLDTIEDNDRFYVMMLQDFTKGSYSRFTWYDNAYDVKISDYSTVTSTDFGTGRKNTETMMKNVYGKGLIDGDIFKHIDDEFAKGWFLPSRGEMIAFISCLQGKGLKMTDDSITAYGLSRHYWTSSLKSSTYAWRTYNNMSSYISSDYISAEWCVRLSTTF